MSNLFTDWWPQSFSLKAVTFREAERHLGAAQERAPRLEQELARLFERAVRVGRAAAIVALLALTAVLTVLVFVVANAVTLR